MSDSPRKTSARTEATRAALISTAEKLFAEQGVDRVSVSEITRVAGQKNRNAVLYHFGSKQALIDAIFEKHAQPIGELRQEMLEELASKDSIRLEDIASALVRPVAARFDDPDGGIAYIKISAQLAATSVLNFLADESDGGARLDFAHGLTPLWGPFLKQLPDSIRDQRMSLIVGMLFHGLADHAVYRSLDDTNLANTELMVSNLIDSICAVLRGPVSPETLSLT